MYNNSALPCEINQAEECGLEELGHDQRALDSNQRHPGKCDGPLFESVDGDVVRGEVPQVAEELFLHGRRQRALEVLDVCKGRNSICVRSDCYALRPS